MTTTTPIKTPQDAMAAYLRGELDEAEFRESWASFGRVEMTLEEALTSNGFLIKFPENMIEVAYSPDSTADVIAKLNEPPPETGGPEPTAPTLTAVTPATVVAGSATTYTLTGTGFTSGSVVSVDGASTVSGFTSETELTADHTPAAAATLSWTVANGDLTSSAVTSEVTAVQRDSHSSKHETKK